MGKLSKHLVLGYGGFIGTHMYKYLDKKGHFVLSSTIDLRDYKNALEVTKGIDYVWHFAANMGGIGYFTSENYQPPIDNYLIDLNVLRACEANKVKRLFYPASACAYPVDAMNDGVKLKETMLWGSANPDQMYGWEKLTMIKLMKESPVDCRVGVLHTIYGPGQEFDGKKAKFPPQIAFKAIRAIKSKKIEVWGDGTQTRTFLYIDDAVRKIYELTMKKRYEGETNIGSDKEVSINDVVKLCCDILKIKPKIVYLTDKPVGPTRRLCNNKKYNTYNAKFKETSLKIGFKRIINYIKKYEQ